MYFVSNGTDSFGSMEEVAPFIAYVLQTLMIAVTLVVVLCLRDCRWPLP